MSKDIDLSKPLSEEDEAWLLERSRGWQIDENKRILADAEEAKKERVKGEAPEEEWKPSYTVASPPFDAPGPSTRQVPRPVGIEGRPQVEPAGELGDAQPVAVEEVDEEVPVEELTVEELKEELRGRELPVSGNRDELVKRLNKALKEEG